MKTMTEYVAEDGTAMKSEINAPSLIVNGRKYSRRISGIERDEANTHTQGGIDMLPKNEFEVSNEFIDREMRKRNFFVEHQGGGCIAYVRYLYVDKSQEYSPAVRIMATNTEGVDIPDSVDEKWYLGVHSDFHEERYEHDCAMSVVTIKNFDELLKRLDANIVKGGGR